MINISVLPLTQAELRHTYTLAIAAIGFEQRGRFAFGTVPFSCNVRLAIKFSDRQFHDFSQNSDFFGRLQYRTVPADLAEVRATVRKALAGGSTTEERTVLVDISSLNRAHIAAICYE